MMQLNGQQLSVYEIFWHLYLAANEPATKEEVYALATIPSFERAAHIVFSSIETNGLHGVRGIGDGYCESMPQEFSDEVISDLLYALDATRPLSVMIHSLRRIVDAWIVVAQQLALSEEEYRPPIKAFIVATDKTYIIRQGYQVERNEHSINEALDEAGYMPKDWLDYPHRSIERNGRIRHAIRQAISDNYWGDTTIQVYSS